MHGLNAVGIWCTITLMNADMIVLFGLPGAGKSFVADVLGDSFGYTLHNGDEDLPISMKQALLQKAPITDRMREEFTERMISSLSRLSKEHTNLACHQTLLKEFMRERLQKEFPTATFILVTSETAIREKRYMKRKYFNLGLPYLRQMSQAFEAARIPHQELINQNDGRQEILAQLTGIVS